MDEIIVNSFVATYEKKPLFESLYKVHAGRATFLKEKIELLVFNLVMICEDSGSYVVGYQHNLDMYTRVCICFYFGEDDRFDVNFDFMDDAKIINFNGSRFIDKKFEIYRESKHISWERAIDIVNEIIGLI